MLGPRNWPNGNFSSSSNLSKIRNLGVAGKKWGTRGWSCPWSQVSPWDWAPSEGPWLHIRREQIHRYVAIGKENRLY